MNIFLAKQSIYNRQNEIVAYELLYRNSYKNYYDESVDGNYATLQVCLLYTSDAADEL